VSSRGIEGGQLNEEALKIDVLLDRIVELDLLVAIGSHYWFGRPHRSSCSNAWYARLMTAFSANP